MSDSQANGHATFFEAARVMLKVELTALAALLENGRCSYSEIVEKLNALAQRFATLKPDRDTDPALERTP